MVTFIQILKYKHMNPNSQIGGKIKKSAQITEKGQWITLI
jgi:hypothetical protein